MVEVLIPSGCRAEGTTYLRTVEAFDLIYLPTEAESTDGVRIGFMMIAFIPMGRRVFGG